MKLDWLPNFISLSDTGGDDFGDLVGRELHGVHEACGECVYK